MHENQMTGGDVTTALETLGRARSTGVLTIVSAEGSATIGLREGGVLFATSPNTPRLGDVLRNEGLVDEEALESAIRVQRRQKEAGFLGQLLTDFNLVSREAARQVIERQILRVFSEVMSWREAEYRFEPVERSWDGVVVPSCCDVGQYLIRVALLKNKAGAAGTDA